MKALTLEINPTLEIDKPDAAIISSIDGELNNAFQAASLAPTVETFTLAIRQLGFFDIPHYSLSKNGYLLLGSFKENNKLTPDMKLESDDLIVWVYNDGDLISVEQKNMVGKGRIHAALCIL